MYTQNLKYREREARSKNLLHPSLGIVIMFNREEVAALALFLNCIGQQIVALINSEIANLPLIMYARLSNRLYGVEWVWRIIRQDSAVRIACEPADSGK